MKPIHSPMLIKEHVKRINFCVIIYLALSAVFFGCSAGSGGGPGTPAG